MELQEFTREQRKAYRFTTFICEGTHKDRVRLSFHNNEGAARAFADAQAQDLRSSSNRDLWIDVVDTHTGAILYSSEKFKHSNEIGQ